MPATATIKTMMTAVVVFMENIIPRFTSRKYPFLIAGYRT
jgi:hypothetical protein